MRFNWRTGLLASKRGPDRAPVSLSVLRERISAWKTPVISGPISLDSSHSALLQLCLENKLRARLAKYGSPEYALTWKHWDMELGVQICALRASARRTSGKDSTGSRSGWPTPTQTDAERRGEVDPDAKNQTLNTAAASAGWRSPDSNNRGGAITDPEKVLSRMKAGHQVNLEDQATLAGWPTPNAMEGGQTSRSGNRKDELLMGGLVGWPTCSSRDWKDSPGMATTGTNPDGSMRSRLDQLPRVAALAGWTTPQTIEPSSQDRPSRLATGRTTEYLGRQAGWATPRAEDAESSGMRHSRGVADTLSSQVGQDLTSSTVATTKRGALNPAHSRWLQGYPVAWCQAAIRALRKPKPQPKRASRGCAVTATRLSPNSQPNSSVPTKT
jgi:hypothetical protein